MSPVPMRPAKSTGTNVYAAHAEPGAGLVDRVVQMLRLLGIFERRLVPTQVCDGLYEVAVGVAVF
jgi:hypothetical protein